MTRTGSDADEPPPTAGRFPLPRSGGPRRVGVILVLVAPVLGFTGFASAHVDYVTDGGDPVEPLRFVLGVLAEPFHAALLGGGGLLVALLALVYLRYRPARRDVEVFRRAVDDYRDLLPWLLRLGFGLPLVGAGFAGYLFSPAVPIAAGGAFAPARLFQVGVGFLLLFGLATRAVALAGLAAYLGTLAVAPRVFLANEFVTGLVAVALLGGGRPSADHVLAAVADADGTLYGRIDPVNRVATALDRWLDPYEPFVATVVRVGLGLNFAYLGLTQKLLAPGPALAVVEKYDLTAVVPVSEGLWVVGAGLTELALGLALAVGLFTRAGALLALGMFTLTLFGLADDPVLAHVTLFGLASALVITGSGPLSLDRLLGTTTGGTAPPEGPGERDRSTGD